MEGYGLIKSFREIVQNQLLFGEFGIMKTSGGRNKELFLSPKFVYVCLILPKTNSAETACRLCRTQLFLLEN